MTERYFSEEEFEESGKAPGIGSLKEKTLHAVLKEYLEPNPMYREIPVGRFVADIANPEGIVEIQTGGFYKLKNKLAAFLPEHPVTVVFPAVGTKHLIWVNPETGELSPARRSPKKNGIYDGLRELYGIMDYLPHPNLTIRILVLEMEEYKLLDGFGAERKRHASKYDRIPLRIEKEIFLRSKEDYEVFLPDTLPEPFTAKDFSKVSRLSQKMAPRAMKVLLTIGVLDRQKEGRHYIYYRRNGDNER